MTDELFQRLRNSTISCSDSDEILEFMEHHNLVAEMKQQIEIGKLGTRKSEYWIATMGVRNGKDVGMILYFGQTSSGGGGYSMLVVKDCDDVMVEAWQFLMSAVRSFMESHGATFTDLSSLIPSQNN